MIHRRQRSTSLISLLLLVLLARALVPDGFMPAADGSAQLTLCPDGMLMPAAGGHLHTEHCPFGSAPFAAPLAHVPLIPHLAGAVSTPGFRSSAWMPGIRASSAHQPRAPPYLNV